MNGIGEALALLAGFCYATAYVLVAKGAGGKGGDNGAFLSVIMTAVLAGLVWLPGAVVHGIPPLGEGAAGVAWFALSGILTIILGRALFYASIASLGAIRASAINRLNPFFSVVLAAVLLGEVITVLGGVGMGLIAIGFAILVWRMLRAASATGQVGAARSSPAAYLYGPASALCYALGLIARKLGLAHIPDASLGTTIGALSALLAYLGITVFSERYRSTIRGLAANTTRWHVLSAVAISVGQLSQFAAIMYIEVSRVVMINTTEVVFSLVLSVYVLKTEHRPGADTVFAALLAACGALLIAAG